MPAKRITGAEQVVVLLRNGDEWAWADGVIDPEDAHGFTSPEEALADYQSNPPEDSSLYVTVYDVTIDMQYRRNQPPAERTP